MYRRYRPLAIPQTQPTPRFLPPGRYARMNPLLCWFGLHLLAEPLPEALRAALIRAWMHPGRFDDNQAIQNLHRQRPPEAYLPTFTPGRLGLIAQIELEASSRVVETSRTSINREFRSKLLQSQGAYLRSIYAALVTQLGDAGALAEFERLLRAIR